MIWKRISARTCTKRAFELLRKAAEDQRGFPAGAMAFPVLAMHQGGIPAVTDDIRTADTDNPRGYYEFESVKKTKEDSSWLPGARGKVVKMVSSLLYDLPVTESYRIVFMRRDIDKMLESQEKMLARLSRTAAPRDQMKKSFSIHLDRLFHWFPTQLHIKLLEVSDNDLLLTPESEICRVVAFLDHVQSASLMHAAIDPKLYRNRRGTQAPNESCQPKSIEPTCDNGSSTNEARCTESRKSFGEDERWTNRDVTSFESDIGKQI